MTHDYPSLLPAVLPPLRGAKSTQSTSALRPANRASAVHYPSPPRSRVRLAMALLVSASVHAGVFFGIHSHKPVAAHIETEHLIAVSIPMPDLKELEEPEPTLTDVVEKPDLSEYAPTLADVPQIALPNAFVQEINFASLIPHPDLTDAKVIVIPHIRSSRLGEGLGDIFNLADLDRVPEPIVQPSPVFPQMLKREVTYAKVVVEFIVNTEGRVVNPVVVETTYAGFEDAAMFGVSRWRFRPGMRAGRKVNTRMSVPIIFRIRGEDNP